LQSRVGYEAGRGRDPSETETEAPIKFTKLLCGLYNRLKERGEVLVDWRRSDPQEGCNYGRE
jgi:hypothetical protein